MTALTARARRHALSLLAALVVTPVLPPVASASDPALEVQAKAALAADPELAGLTLMVSVVDRIAVVGGALPDADLAARVESAVRKVPGLTDVRVTCWVAGGTDPLKQLVADRLAQGTRPPLVLVPRPPAPEAPPPQLALAPREPRPELPLPKEDRVTVQRIAAPPALAGLLQAPVTADGRRTHPAQSYSNIPAPAVPAATVGASLADLRRDPRFSGLTVEFRARQAVIGGRAASHADTWVFADAISKLPGVGLVVMGHVKVP